MADEYINICKRIAAAAERSGRAAADVTLLAVSKTKSVADIERVIGLGQRLFGENRVQEALPKIEALSGVDNINGVQFHLIGSLQKNKVRQIVPKVQMIQSVDSTSLLQEIDKIACKHGVVQDFLIQVNIGDEAQKGGVSLLAIDELVCESQKLCNVRLRGFMCIPPNIDNGYDGEAARPYFAKMKRIYDEYAVKIETIDTLSMGMSGDFEVAIEEGATMVRIGSAIFGAR